MSVTYRHVLMIAELAGDACGLDAAIRGLAPQAERLIVVAVLPSGTFPRLSADAPAEADEETDADFAALRDRVAGAAREVDVRLVPSLSVEALEEIVTTSDIDLVAAGPLPLPGILAVAELRKQRSLSVLWVPQAAMSGDNRPLKRLLCVAMSRRAGTSIAAFLREHTDTSHKVTVLSSAVIADSAAAINVAGIAADVTFLTVSEGLQAAWRDGGVVQGDFDLAVFARFPVGLLASAFLSLPCLVLPPLPTQDWAAPDWRIDAPDIVDDGEPLRVRLEYAAGVGRRAPVPDQEIVFVSEGRVAGCVTTEAGMAQLPASWQSGAYGLFRADRRDASDPVAATEHVVSVIRPGSAPLVLFDANLADRELDMLRNLTGRCDLLAVRMRATRSCQSIRERLRGAGLDGRVADASLVLDEGEALDVPDTVDAVRLARVASRMRGAGFPVTAIVYQGTERPDVAGFAALRPEEVSADRLPDRAPAPRLISPDARLNATGAPLLPGNQIEVELDNARARQWLLSAIAASRERVHVQVYMARDDDIGRQLESALVEAAGGGVQVRMLVDSLYGPHGSLSARNPLLDRLDVVPGVEFRLSQPLAGLPSVEQLKCRDHRKLVTIDGALALLGGRNFSHEYYTGFSEVALTPRSMWREVPWLDAGARVEGPAVADLERSFLQAWTDAGGAPFEVTSVPPAGSVSARVVLHRSLRDARTLETYVALIDMAKSHVCVINGFPMILEIQHALLRALRRGVQVRVLFGQLTPTHAGGPFQGSWAAARTAATSFVHSRVDALVAAGCEAYQFSVPEQPAWEKGLGAVRSHVHAKLMSVDGRLCAVGSANMDLTGGYWESELLLVVEGAPIARGVEARFDELVAHSVQIDRNDPQWRQLAQSREWMRYWPSVLS